MQLHAPTHRLLAALNALFLLHLLPYSCFFYYTDFAAFATFATLASLFTDNDGACHLRTRRIVHALFST